VTSCIWHWIANYNNFNFSIHCNSLIELWHLDNCISYKANIICELMRGAVLWVLWNERNILIFEGGNIKSVRMLGGDIIFLNKY
jgi:hypothetical protein